MKPLQPDAVPAFTVPALAQARAEGRKLTMLTAYDAGFAHMVDAAGIDMILVGDSLGMVVQGAANTLAVTVDDVAYHTRCVASAVRRALIIADLPFLADATPERALEASQRFLAAGAGMVKLEGAGHKCAVIHHLAEREIPVCAHLGLTPQSVLRMGGFRVQGRSEDAAAALKREAREVEAAGAVLLVLEGVPSPLAARITGEIGIPTIGIGAGPGCDGQVLVLHDMLGLDSGHRRPKFVRDFLSEGGSVAGALAAYRDAVQAGTFPDSAHSYAS